MQAILELNDFQKIIEIDRFDPEIRMFYIEPGKVVENSVSGLTSNVNDNIDYQVITFRFQGKVGNFLLYKYFGY